MSNIVTTNETHRRATHLHRVASIARHHREPDHLIVVAAVRSANAHGWLSVRRDSRIGVDVERLPHTPVARRAPDARAVRARAAAKAKVERRELDCRLRAPRREDAGVPRSSWATLLPARARLRVGAKIRRPWRRLRSGSRRGRDRDLRDEEGAWRGNAVRLPVVVLKRARLVPVVDRDDAPSNARARVAARLDICDILLRRRDVGACDAFPVLGSTADVAR